MSTIHNTYPIFEGDQVLTASHLNGLRTFLEARNLSTRSRLIGSGIVCGLNIIEIRQEFILVSAGLGISSKGYLLELAESDCRFITEYKDKPVSDTGEKTPLESPGFYDLFRIDDDDEEQVPVWELLTAEEEKRKDDPKIRPIRVDGSGEINFAVGESETTVKLSDHVLVLYLEIDDEDLESCFGENCDDKGIRRSFNVRKLLVPESAIAGSSVEKPESKKFLCINRPVFGGNENNYSLSQTGSYTQFRQRYEAVIEKNARELEQLLRGAWTTWPALLKQSFRSNPFQLILQGTTLAGKINSSFAGTVYNTQQKFDCIKFLIQAWNEFFDAAEQATAYCLPDTDEFPRHLILGPAEQSFGKVERIPYRHYFRSSAAQDYSKTKTRDAILKYQRLVEMTRHIRAVPPSSSPVRITPGEYAPEKLSEQPIPFYFRIDGNSKLDDVWNPERALRFRFGENVSWHKRNGTGDACIRQPMDHDPDRHSFYRIEGHIGKPFAEVLQNLEGQRQRMNMPVKVIGLKLSNNPANISFDNECKFDDLEQQYELLTTELSCLFEEEIAFFTNLQIRRQPVEKVGDIGAAKAEAEMKPAPEVSIGSRVETEFREAAVPKTGTMEIEKASALKTHESTAFNIFHDNKLLAGQTLDGAQFMAMKYDPPVEHKITTQPAYFTTGDLLQDQLQKYKVIDYYRIHHDYPELFTDVRLPDLMIMKPVELANQIRTILQLLPEKLGDLDENRLNAAFDSLVNIATAYRDELRARQDDLNGQKAMILYRLDKLIHNCARQKLLALQARFHERVRKYSELRLFKKFAETHSGMEHQSGVPKGGTFVIVYVDENERQEPPGILPVPRPAPISPISPQPVPPSIQPFPMPVKPSLADVLISSPSELTRSMSQPMTTAEVSGLTKDLHAITNTLKLESGLSAQLKNQITKLEVDFERKIGDLIRIPPVAPAVTRNVVVADFALPYLYKCECPEVSMIVISQITFSLSKTEFCKKDTTRYEFITDPAGGIVESDAGGVIAEGNRYFFEPAKARPENENVRFTYQVNNQTVVFNIRLFNPVADFSYRSGQDEEGNVVVHFVNQSTGAERYEWDFGDGNTSSETNPVHSYQDFEGDRAVVTLNAGKSGCVDRISKNIEITKEVAVEFDIENKENFPVRTYCTSDDQLYRFHTRPEGKLIEGKDLKGVRQTHEGYVLEPSAYAPGSYAFSYMGESLKVKILEGPAGEFSHEVLRETDQVYTIRFSYKARTGDAVMWNIGNREPQEGARVEVTFDKREGNTHDVRMEVTSENRCSVVVTRTLTFDVKPPARAEEEIRPPVEEEEIRLPIEREREILSRSEEEVERDRLIFDDIRRELDLTRDPNLDLKLFEGNNVTIEETERVVDDLKRETESDEGMDRFKTGELNDKMASEFKTLINTTAKLLEETSKTGTEEEVRYTANLLDSQASTLIRLVSNEEKDVNKTSEMGKLLVNLDSTLKTMKEEGVEVDPDKKLEKTVTEAKLAVSEQPKLFEAFTSIERTLKM